MLNLGIAKETKIGVDLCEPCDRGDRNFDVASLGEGNHGGGEGEAVFSKNTGFQVDHMAVIMVAHCSVKGQLVFKGNVFKVRPRG